MSEFNSSEFQTVGAKYSGLASRSTERASFETVEAIDPFFCRAIVSTASQLRPRYQEFDRDQMWTAAWAAAVYIKESTPDKIGTVSEDMSWITQAYPEEMKQKVYDFCDDLPRDAFNEVRQSFEDIGYTNQAADRATQFFIDCLAMHEAVMDEVAAFEGVLADA